MVAGAEVDGAASQPQWGLLISQYPQARRRACFIAEMSPPVVDNVVLGMLELKLVFL